MAAMVTIMIRAWVRVMISTIVTIVAISTISAIVFISTCRVICYRRWLAAAAAPFF